VRARSASQGPETHPARRHPFRSPAIDRRGSSRSDGSRQRELNPCSETPCDHQYNAKRQKIRLAESAALQQLAKAVASTVNHAIEVQLRQSELPAKVFLTFIFKVEPHQELAVTHDWHLLQQLLYETRPLICLKLLGDAARVGLFSWITDVF